MKVEVGRTRIEVDGLNRKTTFIHPAKRGNIFRLEEQLDEESLGKPSMSDQVDLFYEAFVKKQENEDSGRICKEIRKLLNTGFGYVFTGVLWTPEGMYAKDSCSVKEIKAMDERVLQEQLTGKTLSGVVFSKDGLVRFAPYENIIYGEQTSGQLAENTGVIALVGGLEQARRIAEISEKFKYDPYFNGLKDVEEPTQNIAALDSCWAGEGLYVVGGYRGASGFGFAFGVEKTGEASLQNSK